MRRPAIGIPASIGVDLGQVIEFFNNAAADLPDPTRLKCRKLPSMSVVLDGKGNNFANVFEPRNRRVWVPLSTIPGVVQKAFVAAEDRRFFEHHGVDERGIIRAFVGNFANPGRPQGGSTITQQVVKNLLVGDDLTYERKIREIIVASRVESALGKPEILEFYLNSAYLGRGSWGVEMAARKLLIRDKKRIEIENTSADSIAFPQGYPRVLAKVGSRKCDGLNPAAETSGARSAAIGLGRSKRC